MSDFFVAIGLLLVIEGLLLFTIPHKIYNFLEALSRLSEKRIRFIGASSFTVGIIIIWIIRL